MVSTAKQSPASQLGGRHGPGAGQGPSDFFALSTDMLCVAGVDGYFKTLNGAWTRVLGYTTEELLSRPFVDFVHPDDRAATTEEAAKIASGFETIHFRNRYRCKDGTYRWLAWRATPAMLDGSIYASARDVTSDVLADREREARTRELAERERRVRSVLAGTDPRMVFQPVFTLRTGAVRGFEALSRFDATPSQPPDAWFADAASVGLGRELEVHAIDHAIAAAHDVPKSAFLALNVSPSTLVGDELDQALAPVVGDRLVVEVTEHAAVVDYQLLKQAIGRLRTRGVRLAIDDAGAGYSGLNQIVQLVPEFIKLDLFLTRGIDVDSVKRALAAALVNFAKEIGAGLIAEGVETAGELHVLEELGVEHAQGYYLGRPEPLPARTPVGAAPRPAA